MTQPEEQLCAMFKTPEVLEFLFRCTASQIDDPSRFSPSPSYFHNGQLPTTTITTPNTLNGGMLVNMPMFAETVSLCNIKKICHRYQRITKDTSLVKKGMPQSVYELLKFIVSTVNLELRHTELCLSKRSFDNFKVVWSHKVEEAFLKAAKDDNSYSYGITYLYHGSPLRNWHSIIRNGLKVMSGTQYQTSGAILGSGIYLSDSMQKSYSYTRNYGGGIYGMAVVIGVYELYNALQFKKADIEYVVPDEKKLLLRYLLYIPEPGDVVALGANMNMLLQKRSVARVKMLTGTDARREARINKELEQLKAEYTITELKSGYSIDVDGQTIEFSFPPSYPAVPPAVQIDNKITCDTEWSIGWKLEPYLMTIYYNQDRLKNKA